MRAEGGVRSSNARELRLATWTTVINDHFTRDGFGGGGPRSSSISASARSIPAVIPAELQRNCL